MIDRKNAHALTRFRLWLKTFIDSLTMDQKYENIHYVRPGLEALEERTLLSASPVESLPIFSLASPQAAPSLSAVTSYMASVMNEWGQLIEMAQQDVIGTWKAVEQGIAQEASFIQQQWDQLLGIHSVTPTPAPSSVVVPSASSGRPGQGLARASGSGSGAVTTGRDADTPPVGTFRPLEVSGSGSGSGSSSGSSTATVTGQIWLDNDADGSIDENEMDYSGARVTLLYQVNSGGGTTWSTLASTTTNSNLTGNNYSISAVVPPGTSYTCKIDVAIPLDFGDEAYGYENDIDAQGFSPVFTLGPGGMEVVGAALDSMNVNTLSDDPNGVVQQNKVTLRDAIRTGNKGPAVPAVTFDGAGSGTISLQKALDPISKSYDINGPGASTLTVSGVNSFRVFEVKATSTIRGLTISSGFAQNGNGGGILNDSGAQLSLQQVLIANNVAGNAGGGLFNSGTVKIYDGVAINHNNALNGGGIFNDNDDTISAYSYVTIDDNTSTGVAGGGGVFNSLGNFQIFDGGEISGNTSRGDGGGVNNNGTMTLQGVQLQGNTSAGRGGGVFVSLGSLTLTDVSINSFNRANQGGGMFVRGGGTVNMTGGGITNNSATFTGITAGGGLAHGGGGGLFVSGGSVTLTGVSIFGNLSNSDGGGVYNNAGTLTLNNNVSIESNLAMNEGGGMFLAATSTTNFNGVTVSNNTAVGVRWVPPFGNGIYQQNNAKVNPNPPGPPNTNLTDNDDFGGNPVPGP